MKIILLVSLLVMIVTTLFAQETTNTSSASSGQSGVAFALWPGDAPGSLGNAEKDIPTLTPFFPSPETANGAAMVICPGGGYVHLAPHEGEGYAHWLTNHGITCFVLKYRLGGDGYRYPAAFQDATRAIRLIRARANEWKLDPNHVGIIGSSAGGHLASMVMTRFDAGNSNAVDVIDRQSSRPDVAILCYPVITMEKFAHQGSKNSLLGANPPTSLVEETSTELLVTKQSPPCFIWSTDEDTTVRLRTPTKIRRRDAQSECALRTARVSARQTRHGPWEQGI